MALSKGLRMIPTNIADIATLTSTPAFTANSPLAHLQRDEAELIARTTSDEWTWAIRGDFPQALPVSACALLGHTLTTAATWRLRLYLEAGQTGTVLYNSGTIATQDIIPLNELEWGFDPFGATYQAHWNGGTQSRIWLNSPVLARSFRLDVTEGPNPAGYWQASRLVIGRHWAPTENIDFGATLTLVDPSTIARTATSGSRVERQGQPYRRLSFSISEMPEEDRAALFAIKRLCGTTRAVYVSGYAKWQKYLERDFEGMFRFSDLAGPTHTHALGWADRIVMEEV